jgi:dTDP-4-dehydrorhamnose reductase
MKVAITGSQGVFGQGLVEVFRLQHEVFTLTHAEADITNPEQIRTVMGNIRPDLIIHSAAIPSLDICEDDPPQAYLVNVHGTRNVVEAAREVGAAVVHISTDSVFDGEKRSPYVETDPPNPRTVYGRTKVRAEGLVSTLPRYWIFRVSVLFGPGKPNFLTKGLAKIRAGLDYVVASDQIGTATYTLDAAHKIQEVAERAPSGIYHLSNQGTCSRVELARYAAKIAGLDPSRVVGKPDAQMGRRARRVLYAAMEMSALRHAGFTLPRPWQEAVADYIRTLQAQA